MMMRHNTKFGDKMFGGLEDVIRIRIDISTLRCDLDLKCSNLIHSNSFFSQGTVPYDNVLPNKVWWQKDRQFRK